ncbi:MAG TPA: Crp/Fnr family transcriptional regulator [Polyangiaceae bacterium]|nr:Crp/Fnr family transcriptional regulator [Polyangiaceae bacterium]
MIELTTDDLAAFAQSLNGLGNVDRPAYEAALALFRARELERGQYLLRAGEVACEVGILVSGLLREHFVTSAGVERTKSFICPNDWTGSLADLLTGQPARTFIAVERRSRVLVAPYRELRALELGFPALAQIGRGFAERLLVSKAEREYQLLCFDAEARYDAFLARYAELEQIVSQRYIASYLGITPIHLSRLRRRRARKLGRTS